MNEEMQVAAAIVAEVDEMEQAPAVASSDPRLDELDRRIRDLEAAIGDLRTVAAQAVPSVPFGLGRKTAVSPAMAAASAKGEAGEPNRAAALDATLGSLSIEQRIAVKSGMIRAGLL